jgi:hypothetical protein
MKPCAWTNAFWYKAVDKPTSFVLIIILLDKTFKYGDGAKF